MGYKLIVVVLAFFLVLNLTPYGDQAGEEYFDKALKNAAATFAVARVLNGIISVIQHVEVAATPAGVGLSVAPGQVLDPLNDLVEQFSTVMLMATVSLAIQKLLLTISGWWATKIAIAGLLGLLLLLLILGARRGGDRVRHRGVLFKFALLLLFVRFVLPFVAVSSSVVEALFLSEPIQVKTEKLKHVEQSAASVIETEEDQKWHESLMASGKNLIKVRENVALLKEKLSSSISTIIDLIALFIIQTVLLPLVFLYLAVKLVKQLFALEISGPVALPSMK